MMGRDPTETITAWLVERGLAGASETELLRGFCHQLRDAGFAVSRGLTIIDTLHPTYEGRAFRWTEDAADEASVLEYGRTTEGQAAEKWRRSIFHHLLSIGGDELHLPVRPDTIENFSLLEDVTAEGHTAVFALLHRFGQDGIIGGMDCVYSYWCTRTATGFTPSELDALRRLVPILSLAIKAASLTRIAGTLVDVYLGRDAGRHVLSGRILRGVAERINAVLWFSDLRDFTRITDSADPDEVIRLLNDYADAVISAVQGAGGDVLKLIGDGILAIFTADHPAEACRCALAAEADLRRRLSVLNRDRSQQGRPVTTVYLGLHIGDVSYGNIGSNDRLDFTVVGAAVNQASRIAALCRSADREVLLSAAFVAASAEAERQRCVSVGRYMLRGVTGSRELFTLEDAPVMA